MPSAAVSKLLTGSDTPCGSLPAPARLYQISILPAQRNCAPSRYLVRPAYSTMRLSPLSG